MRLDEKFKFFESFETGRRFIPLLPVIVRLDGQRFTKFTNNFNKPFDAKFASAMDKVTKQVMKTANALFGYTQSDEINLILYSDSYESKLYFDSKIQKLVSSLASLTSVLFFKEINLYKESCFNTVPTFDCRIFTVPTIEEACQYILLREFDSERNSVQMLARSLYSHKECDGKKTKDLKSMMKNEKEVNWDEISHRFQRGAFFQKRKVIRAFTDAEVALLPQKHDALKNNNLQYERNDIIYLENLKFREVSNKKEVIFYGHEPYYYPF